MRMMVAIPQFNLFDGTTPLLEKVRHWCSHAVSIMCTRLGLKDTCNSTPFSYLYLIESNSTIHTRVYHNLPEIKNMYLSKHFRSFHRFQKIVLKMLICNLFLS